MLAVGMCSPTALLADPSALLMMFPLVSLNKCIFRTQNSSPRNFFRISNCRNEGGTRALVLRYGGPCPFKPFNMQPPRGGLYATSPVRVTPDHRMLCLVHGSQGLFLPYWQYLLPPSRSCVSPDIIVTISGNAAFHGGGGGGGVMNALWEHWRKKDGVLNSHA